MKRAEPGWLVLALAGIAALIGSFLPFYTFGSGVDLTVWNRSLFPTATLIPLILFGIGVEALFVLLMGYEPKSPFLNFTWSQARLAGGTFAIVLSLTHLVQGRAGGSLGSGYIIMSLSSLATFAGAVMTRRAELARRREMIVEAEHPWRAAVLRWRSELAEKVRAIGASDSAQEAQVAPAAEAQVAPVPEAEEAPAADTTLAEPEAAQESAKPDEKPDEPSPEPSPVPRLSAVQSEPTPDEKDEKPATEKDVDTEADSAAEAAVDTAVDTTAEAALDTTAEAAVDTAVEATAEAAVEATAEMADEADVEPELHDDDEERERPAAPG